LRRPGALSHVVPGHGAPESDAQETDITSSPPWLGDSSLQWIETPDCRTEHGAKIPQIARRYLTCGAVPSTNRHETELRARAPAPCRACRFLRSPQPSGLSWLVPGWPPRVERQRPGRHCVDRKRPAIGISRECCCDAHRKEQVHQSIQTTSPLSDARLARAEGQFCGGLAAVSRCATSAPNESSPQAEEGDVVQSYAFSTQDGEKSVSLRRVVAPNTGLVALAIRCENAESSQLDHKKALIVNDRL
jgi:hypothetical protein